MLHIPLMKNKSFLIFLKEEKYLQAELDNVSMLPHIENEGYTEEMDIPEVYYP